MADKDLSNKQLAAGFGGEQQKIVGALGVIADKLDKQTSAIETEMETDDLEKRIKNLGGFLGTQGNEDTKQLKQAFQTINADLESAIASGDTEAENIARRQLEALEKTLQSEEKRREQEKLLREQNDFLKNTADGVTAMGKGFDEFAGNVTGSVGFLAAISGIALLFIDPQKFAKLVGDAITSVANVLSNLVKLFNGEQGIVETMENMEDDFGTFALMLGGVALLLGGTLITSAGSLIAAAAALKTFMMVKFFPMMGAAISGLVTGFASVLSAVIPVVAPIALAVLGAMALYAALDAIAEALGFEGIFDAVLVAVAYMSDGLSALGNFFIMLGKFIGDAVGSVAEFFGFDIPPALKAMADAEYLATDSGSKKKAEMQAKAKQAELERIAKGEGKEDPYGFGTVLESTIPTPEEIAAAQAELGFDVENVGDIANNLVITPPSSVITEGMDAETKAIVEQAMMQQNQAPVQNIVKGGDTSTSNSSVVTINNGNTGGFLDNELGFTKSTF